MKETFEEFEARMSAAEPAKETSRETKLIAASDDGEGVATFIFENWVWYTLGEEE